MRWWAPTERPWGLRWGGWAQSQGGQIPLVPLVLLLLCCGTPRAKISRSHCDPGVVVRSRTSLKLCWVALLSQTWSSRNWSRRSRTRQHLVGIAASRWALGRSEALLWASQKCLWRKFRDANFHVRLVGNFSSLIRSLKANLTLFYSPIWVRSEIYLIDIVFRQNTGEKLCDTSTLSPCCWKAVGFVNSWNASLH